MIELPRITMVAITTRDYGETIVAIKKSLEQIKPARTIFFTDIPYEDEQWENIIVPKFDWNGYNQFVVKELYKYITTSHLLIIQNDGFILNGSQWDEAFLDYDYIGAPWFYRDGRNVGNGGFSLRSAKLHNFIALDPCIEITTPEDEIICRLYRNYLEQTYSIKYAPEVLANKFSFELNRPLQPTFGFHGKHHEPYKEPIIISRVHSMGDIIMTEPVMHWFHTHGYRVILDCDPYFYGLFHQHYFFVEHLENIKLSEDVRNYRVVNLNMAYEVAPKELVLDSYYKAAGIKDGVLRNSRLNFVPTSNTKLFDKYIVLHIDQTDMPYRNIHGVHWQSVVEFLKAIGYQVFQIGNLQGIGEVAPRINTVSSNMLAYVISGASYFIGVDSGPSHIAVACGVKSMIFFGSVNPSYRYPDLDNIFVMQKDCPINKQNCYHDVLSVNGQKCQVDGKEKYPPCIHWYKDEIIESLQRFVI